MSEQSASSEIMAQVLAELKDLRRVVAEQQTEIDLLKAQTQAPSASSPDQRRTNRRRMLKQLAAGVVAGVVAAGGPGATLVQANVISGANPGALILAGGATTQGQLPQFRYGVVASSDKILDFGAMLPTNTAVSGLSGGLQGAGVYGFSDGDFSYGVLGYNTSATGIGVYGYCSNGLGIGVYGFSEIASGLAVSGGNEFGTAIYGDSGYSYGVHGRSFAGAGLVAESTEGVPFRILPGPAPISGTRQYGDIYVDTTGKIFVWADGASPTFPGWRQLQFAP